jgi:hypothetical protein
MFEADSVRYGSPFFQQSARPDMIICSDPCFVQKNRTRDKPTCYFCARSDDGVDDCCWPLASDFSSWRDYRVLSGEARSWIKDRLRKDMIKHDVVIDIDLTRVDKLNSSVRKKP